MMLKKHIFASKCDVFEMAIEIGLPVPEGIVASNISEAAEYIDFHGNKSFFVSLETGAGGSGVSKVKTGAELLDEFPLYEGRVLVTNWINNIELSPNVLIMVGPDKVDYLAITDQILINNTKYSGNKSPSNANREAKRRIKDYSFQFGELLREKKFYGRAGIDFMLSGETVWFGEGNTGRDNHSSLQNVLARLGHDSYPIPVIDAGILLNASGDYPDSYDLIEKPWKMELIRAFPGTQMMNYTSQNNDKELFENKIDSSIITSTPLNNTNIIKSKKSHDDKMGSSDLVEIGRLVAHGPNFQQTSELEKRKFFSQLRTL